MDRDEKNKLAKLLGKGYIERKQKKQIVKGRNGEEIPVLDTQKVTGLDEQGGIVDAEIDKISTLGCDHISKGRENLEGQCAICGAYFCNKIVNGKPSCYRRCNSCNRMICMKHVRGMENAPVLCSFKCMLSYNLKRLLRDNWGTVIIVCVGIIVLILGLMKSRH